MGSRDHSQDPQAWGPREPQRPPPQGPPPKKRRRVFLWVFLAIQILFLIWVITGAASGSGTPEGCQGLTGDELDTCNAASDVGTTIGVGLMIALWAAVDVILGFSYVVYRLASRRT